jgi:ribosomal protein S18 acetylase RimI-like enzyme
MILLSPDQANEYAIPLIRQTMGDELGDRAAYEFSECEATDLWGLWDMNVLVCVAGIGAEISPKKVWMGYLAVRPGYVRRGLATRGLDFIEAEMANRGYRWCLVETYGSPVFDAAVSLYRKRGYKKIGDLADYLDDGADIVYFRKQLTSPEP